MDIPTCAALPSLDLAGMVSECKTLEMHAFTSWSLISVFHIHKIFIFNPNIYFSAKFCFYFVLNSMQNKKWFWKADVEWNQHPPVNVHPLALVVALEYWISAFACCVSACVLFPLFFALSYLVCKVFVVNSTGLQSMKQSYVAIEMFAIMVIPYYVFR